MADDGRVREALQVLATAGDGGDGGVVMPTGTWFLLLRAVCIGLGIMLALSMLPDMRRWRQTGTTGNKKFAPLFSMTLNYTIGLAYGVTLRDTTIMATRGTSITLTSIFVYHFVRHHTADDAAEIRRSFLLGYGLAAVIYVGMKLFVPESSYAYVLGYIGLAASLFMSAAPLTNIATILRTRDASSIPFAYTVLGAAAAAAWAVYGAAVGNGVVLAQNVLGLFIGGSQLVLLWKYPAPTGVAEKVEV